MAIDQAGWLSDCLQIPSPNCDPRPGPGLVSLLVIHAISLPPCQYGGPGVSALFTNAVDPEVHLYYQSLMGLKVSAHAFIRRSGRVVQYVPFELRAWHAGVSNWLDRERCNDFSIGIELEGDDFSPFTDAQYASLNCLGRALLAHYPIGHVVAHSDIAPGRKTDPGPFFEWSRLSFMETVEGRIAAKSCKTLA